MNAIITVAPLDELAARIQAEHEAAQAGMRAAVAHALRCGELLLEAKRLVGHGNWLPWLRERCAFSTRTVQGYMKLASDPANAQRVADLSLRGALALLAEPRGGTHETWTGAVEWYTPRLYVEAARAVMGGIDLDPASSEAAQRTVRAGAYHTAATDGLAHPWRGRIFLNPPYRADLIAAFVAKLLAEHAAGHVAEAVLLVHARTDAAWFHDAARDAAALCFTRGRIRFEQPDGAGDSPTTGSAFFYFGGRADRFVATFGDVGVVLRELGATGRVAAVEDGCRDAAPAAWWRARA